MTTEFTKAKNPCLPENYAAHLDRVAPPAQDNGFCFVVLLFAALGLLTVCVLLYAHLSP